MAKGRKQATTKVAQRKKTKVKSDSSKPRCRIAVLGVGGAGNQVISRLVNEGFVEAECVAINTDLKDLNYADAARKVLIGEKVTRGLSAGGNPEAGKAAAQESRANIENLVENVDVVFVVVGLGGGTGTGAAPVVAEIARNKGAVVVGVVTTPFRVGEFRSGFLTDALSQMRVACDTVVLIDNDRILKAVSGLPFKEVYKVADHVLANMIRGIVQTLSGPSMVNLDLNEFKTIVREGGVATVGIGESAAPNRVEQAVQNAMDTSFLNVDYNSATGALIQVSGDTNLTVQEVDRVRELVTEKIGHGARLAWGARVNPRSEGLQVTLVMTGVDSSYSRYGLGNMIPELYDIESSYSEPEKSLTVDFELDQIEGVED